MKLDPRACSQLLKASNPIRLFGKVNKVVGLVAEGGGLRAPLGAVCHMLPLPPRRRKRWHRRRGRGLS